jgi:hypothetical protein
MIINKDISDFLGGGGDFNINCSVLTHPYLFLNTEG